ncbi:MAG: LptF/LptG family permease [Puniceicoccaceae bacterium]
MRCLDWYVLGEWLKIFLLCLGLVVAVLLLQETYNDLPALLDSEATLGEIVRYFLILVPGFIPTLVPLGMLVSVLFAVGTLHRTQELTAMWAAGISLWRISLPLWAAGIGLTGGLFWLGASVVPQTQELARQEYEQLRYGKGRAADDTRKPWLYQNLGFSMPGGEALWHFNFLDTRQGMAEGASWFSIAEDGRELERRVGERAEWNEAREGWMFYDGLIIQRAPLGTEIVAEIPFKELLIPADGLSPRVMASLQAKPQDLSLARLREVVGQFSVGQGGRLLRYEIVYQRALAEPLACLVAVAFGVPFAASGVRRNPFVGTSRAIGVFLLYLIGGRILALMGSRGLIEPILAAWLPPVIALTFGLWLFLRGR